MGVLLEGFFFGLRSGRATSGGTTALNRRPICEFRFHSHLATAAFEGSFGRLLERIRSL